MKMSQVEYEIDLMRVADKLNSCTQFQKDIFDYLRKDYTKNLLWTREFPTASKILERTFEFESAFNKLSKEQQLLVVSKIYPARWDASAILGVIFFISFIFFIFGIVTMFFELKSGLLMTVASSVVGIAAYSSISTSDSPQEKAFRRYTESARSEPTKTIAGIND